MARKPARQIPVASGVGQLHLPGLARSDKKPRAPRKSEAVLQQHCRGVAASVGYASMEVGSTRKRVTLEAECRCPICKATFTAQVSGFPTGWQGNTPGFPDVSYYRMANFPPVFIGIETKGEGTPVTEDQQKLADAGRTQIVWSEMQTLKALLAAELAMDAYRLSDERREMIERMIAESGHRLGAA